MTTRRESGVIASSQATSFRECYDAHEEDARRLCGANTVAATAYRLSPEYRAKLIADRKLIVRIDPSKGKWRRPSPKRITLNAQQRELVISMCAANATTQQIADALGYSYSTTHKFRVMLLAQKADERRAAKLFSKP
jgi:hypothetical protein